MKIRFSILSIFALSACEGQISSTPQGDIFGDNLVKFGKNTELEVKVSNLLVGASKNGRLCVLSPDSDYRPRYFGGEFADVGILFEKFAYHGSEYRWAIAYKDDENEWVKVISRRDIAFIDIPMNPATKKHCGQVDKMWVNHWGGPNSVRFVLKDSKE